MATTGSVGWETVMTNVKLTRNGSNNVVLELEQEGMLTQRLIIKPSSLRDLITVLKAEAE
jgi:hypothetical protein